MCWKITDGTLQAAEFIEQNKEQATLPGVTHSMIKIQTLNQLDS
ncbi:MAG: hypothetical protein WA828_18490 [Coleofasciculaceae cyanobacterium]